MANEDTQVIEAPDDEEEKKYGPPVPPEYVPPPPPAGIIPQPTPPIRQAQPAGPAPTITAPTPNAIPDTGSAMAAGPQTPSQTALSHLSAIQQQNPFTMLMAREENIHNPFLRVLAKVGTGIGRGAETLAPDYAKTSEQRIQAAGQPSEVAQREAQTGLATAETKKAEQETANLGNPLAIVKPIPIYAAPGTANAGEEIGEKGFDARGGYHENMFPGGPAGPQQPAAGAQPTPQANAPAAGGTTTPAPQPARAITTIKPQEPQRAPLPTAEETAKLAPVGQDAGTYNQQIKDALGAESKDFVVKPTDSRERADKMLADASKQAEEDRAKKTEARGQEAQTREQRQADMKPVQGIDPVTKQKVITGMGDAIKNNYQDVLEVGNMELTNAKSTVTNVNLMEQALRAFHENVHDIDALTQNDKNILQEFLNSREMNPAGGALNYVSGSIGSALNSFIQSEKAQTLTDPAKNILEQVANMRESSLGLGKLETGGSRAMQAGIDAINRTLPGTFITSAAEADRQLKMFADRLDEIKSDATIPKGFSFRDSPFKAAAPQKEPTRPANVPKGYTWNAKGPQGAGWYK